MVAKKRRAAKFRPFALVVNDRSAAVCEEVLPVGDGQPIALTGWRDGSGRCRRIRADYANGWELNIRLNAKGEITSSSARIRLVSFQTDQKEAADA